MANPTSSLVTLRPDLRSLEQFDLEMDRLGFVTLKVLPVFEAPEQHGPFGRIKLEQLLRVPDTRRAPKGNYARDDWEFDTISYTTVEHGFEERVDDNEAAMYANYFDYELVCANRATDAVLRSQEVRGCSILQNTTTFTSQTTDATAAGGYAWSNYAAATPIENVETAVRAVWTRTGIWPDTLVLEKHTFRDLRLCREVIDAVRSSGAGELSVVQNITVDMLRRVFDLNKIYVAGSATNANQPSQTRSINSIWSQTYALVCKTPDTNDIKEPCLGRTFHWAGDGSNIGGTFETYREESVRGDIVRCRHQTDEKLIYTEMGQLLKVA